MEAVGSVEGKAGSVEGKAGPSLVRCHTEKWLVHEGTEEVNVHSRGKSMYKCPGMFKELEGWDIRTP